MKIVEVTDQKMETLIMSVIYVKDLVKQLLIKDFFHSLNLVRHVEDKEMLSTSSVNVVEQMDLSSKMKQ